MGIMLIRREHQEDKTELRQQIDRLAPDLLSAATAKVHGSVLDLVEEALIGRALEMSGYNQVRTARLLGISRNTLRHRIKKYGLAPPNGDE